MDITMKVRYIDMSMQRSNAIHGMSGTYNIHVRELIHIHTRDFYDLNSGELFTRQNLARHRAKYCQQ
jgi:hypothetical protein